MPTMVPSPASTTASTTTAVIVVRHGERLDYVLRDKGEKNWIESEIAAGGDRPWDPPLTSNGIDQAVMLGRGLNSILQSLSLPPVTSVYSSPFVRCRQTGAGILKGLLFIQEEQRRADSSTNPNQKVKVELGLSESINENWYRSWAIPGTDGTWGFRKHDLPNPDIETLHPASTVPVQPVLDWKQQRIDLDDELLREFMDIDHQSITTIDVPYSYSSKTFESFKVQRKRMAHTMNVLSERHIGQTIVLISHGGPVTHLYESLTGNHWDVHGESKYCCFSIYQKDTTVTTLSDDDAQNYEGHNANDQKPSSNIENNVNDDGTTTATTSNDETQTTETEPIWIPLVVNRVLWEDDDDNNQKSAAAGAVTTSTTAAATERKASFQWS
jgi:broad specificity phosphatase PhoE